MPTYAAPGDVPTAAAGLEIAALVDTQQDTLAAVTEVAPTVTGGTAPYTYAWTLTNWQQTARASLFTDAAVAAPTWTATGLDAGSMAVGVVVTDADGNVARASRTCEIGKDRWFQQSLDGAGVTASGVTTYISGEAAGAFDLDGARNVASNTWIKTADDASYHWLTWAHTIPADRIRVRLRGIYGATRPGTDTGAEYGPIISSDADPSGAGSVVCGGYFIWRQSASDLAQMYNTWGNYGGWGFTDEAGIAHEISMSFQSNHARLATSQWGCMLASGIEQGGAAGNWQTRADYAITLETARTIHIGMVAGIRRSDTSVQSIPGLNFALWCRIDPEVLP